MHVEGKLAGVTLRDTVTGEPRELPVTGLFVAIGHLPRNELVQGVVVLDDEGYVLAAHADAQLHSELQVTQGLQCPPA